MPGTANDTSRRFDAMSDHATLAVGATRRERLDGAFEAVESYRLAALCYLKSFVVVVAASIANSHGLPPSFLRALLPLSPYSMVWGVFAGGASGRSLGSRSWRSSLESFGHMAKSIHYSSRYACWQTP